MKPDLREIAINALSALVSSVADLIFHVIRMVTRLSTGKREGEVPLKLEKNKKTVGAIALGLVIAVALSSLLLTTVEFQPPLPTQNLMPAQGVGQVVAEETAKLLTNRGTIVVVVMDTGPIENKTSDAELNAFTEAIQAHREITVNTIEKIPSSAVIRTPMGKVIREERFLELFQQHPDADAIVSFIGPPGLTEEQIAGLAPDRPKLVAVAGPATSASDLGRLFEARVLHLAITARGAPGSDDGRSPQTPREWFDRNYVVVTAQTAPSHAP